jgi:hypothetical protein
MHAFAFGAKCGARAASGSTDLSDEDSDASNPSFASSDASAIAPSPEALEVKNSRRAKSTIRFIVTTLA